MQRRSRPAVRPVLRSHTIRRHRPLSRFVALALLASPLAPACGGAKEAGPPRAPVSAMAASARAAQKPLPGRAGVDESALDRTVSPCQDFYQFACGGWMKATPVPPDESAWYRSFNGIAERNELRLREIAERYARGEAKTNDRGAALVGDFYAACMDERAVEAKGKEPLAPYLARIDAVKDAASLRAALIELHRVGIDVFFRFDSTQDFKDANRFTALVEQAGLALPDRDYYVKDDARTKALRSKYQEHVARMLELLGDKDAKARAADVLAVEKTLALASMTRVELREPQKIYNPMPSAELVRAAPGFDWGAYFADAGFADPPLNVAQPAFAKAAARMLSKPNDPKLRTYMRYHLARAFAPSLSERFVEERFRLDQLLTGAEKLPPRWKRCVRATDHAIGEALAKPFVEETLGAEGKSTAQGMVAAVERAMHENVETLAWMDAETRKRAFDKLATVRNKIGYPATWRNYDALTVERASHAANVARASAFERTRQLAKIGKPVDRDEWQMTPPTVNAYYDASLNEMVFAAGILQFPFFDNRLSMAMNYGGIGMVMGHELTHGFDDEGRLFDHEGNMRDWWSETSGAEFDARAKCVEAQYDAYEAVPDGRVNGRLTLGENIADIGGMKLAYKAFRAQAHDEATIGGFTPDQQFFIGFAQAWCANVREEALRLMLATNPHAPPRFRVIGAVANSPAFAEAFSCEAGSPMVRAEADRCEVW